MRFFHGIAQGFFLCAMALVYFLGSPDGSVKEAMAGVSDLNIEGPTSTWLNSPTRYRITVTNSNLFPADKVRVSFDMAPFYDKAQFITTQGSCALTGAGLIPFFECDLGSLKAQSSAMVTLTVTPTKNEGLRVMSFSDDSNARCVINAVPQDYQKNGCVLFTITRALSAISTRSNYEPTQAFKPASTFVGTTVPSPSSSGEKAMTAGTVNTLSSKVTTTASPTFNNPPSTSSPSSHPTGSHYPISSSPMKERPPAELTKLVTQAFSQSCDSHYQFLPQDDPSSGCSGIVNQSEWNIYPSGEKVSLSGGYTCRLRDPENVCPADPKIYPIYEYKSYHCVSEDPLPAGLQCAEGYLPLPRDEEMANRAPAWKFQLNCGLPQGDSKQFPCTDPKTAVGGNVRYSSSKFYDVCCVYPQQIPSTIGAEICRDTDDGKNYDVKGTTTQGKTVSVDSCYDPKVGVVSSCQGDSCALEEYYCENNQLYLDLNYHACPNGCSDGRCLP